MEYERGTAADYFRALANGEESFFTGVGNFLDDFYSASGDEKERLISQPIDLDLVTDDNLRYAAFFSGMVESLCLQYVLNRPDWIWEERYRLRNPWFLYEGWRLRAWQLVTTPPSFKARNIFGGDNMLSRV